MDWEISKENIQPLKKGRSAHGLGAIDKLQLDDGRKEYLAKLERARKSSSTEEVLNTYIEFYSWVRRSSNDSEKAKLLLENCTKEIGQNEQLRNDPRLIKIWLEYADLVQDPVDVFNFMASNFIGSKVALFWIAWAFYLEKGGNFKGADKVFLNGIRQLAQPKDLLNRRYHQFQRRMTRQFLNNDQDFADANEDDRRNFISSANSNKISIKSFKQAKKSESFPAASNNLGFSIFSDETPTEDRTVEKSKELATIWNNLGSEQERRKENEMLKSKWSEKALPMKPPVVSSDSIVANPFPIFVENEFNDNNIRPESQVENAVESVKVASSFARSCSKPPTAIPMTNSKSTACKTPQETAKANMNGKPNKGPSSEIQRNIFVLEKSNDETINTKLALADLEDMFSCSEFDDQEKAFRESDWLPNRRKLFQGTKLCSKSFFHFEAESDVDCLMQRDSSTLNVTQSPEFTLDPSLPTASGIIEDLTLREANDNEELFIDSDCFDNIIQRSLSKTAPLNFQRELCKIYSYPSQKILQKITSLKKMIPIFQSKGEHRCSGELQVLEKVGKGTFGQAVLVKVFEPSHTEDLDNNNGINFVMKIDKERFSIAWECIVHALISRRVLQFSSQSLPLPFSFSLIELYRRCLLPPLYLHQFEDCSLMQMQYAELGTSIDAIAVLVNNFQPSEHEFLVASLSFQMLSTQYLLMKVGIIHGDMKSDNWVLSEQTQLCEREEDGGEKLYRLRVHLIDFGRARIHLIDNRSFELWQRGLKEKGEFSSEFFSSLFLQDCLGTSLPTNEIRYQNGAFAKGFRTKKENNDCSEREMSWTYEHDLYGLAACIYHLLYFQDFQVRRVPISALERKEDYSWLLTPQFKNRADDDNMMVTIPLLAVKRYWNQVMWNQLFLTLLNPHLFARHNREEANSLQIDSDLLSPILLSFHAFVERNSSIHKRTLQKFVHLLQVRRKKPFQHY